MSPFLIADRAPRLMRIDLRGIFAAIDPANGFGYGFAGCMALPLRGEAEARSPTRDAALPVHHALPAPTF